MTLCSSRDLMFITVYDQFQMQFIREHYVFVKMSVSQQHSFDQKLFIVVCDRFLIQFRIDHAMIQYLFIFIFR